MSERDNSREPGVHRLADMVVEEVSLVDRAANKRRYLLVKRSEDMAGENTETETDVDTETAVDTDADDTDDGERDDDEDGDGDDGDDGGDEADKGKPKKPAAGATTEAVVTALEALSGVVEMLANKAAAPPKKKPPGRGAGAGGSDDDEEAPDSDEELDEDEDEDEDAPPARGRKPPAKRQTKGDPLTQVQGALKRLEALVSGKTPQAKRAPAALGDLGAKLDTMTTAIGDLKKLVTGQGERIGKVEKTVGLPASRPVEGKARRKDDDVVSWPLDINAPRDRKSVAKEVSFHD